MSSNVLNWGDGLFETEWVVPFNTAVPWVPPPEPTDVDDAFLEDLFAEDDAANTWPDLAPSGCDDPDDPDDLDEL